jgi:chromate transporter
MESKVIFVRFFKLGLTAFGGPAMIAHIRKMAVEKYHWLDEETFRNGVSLCQMIPGATAIQMAAYVGLKSRGLSGAAASFIGFGLPAFLIMLIFSALYKQTQSLPVTVATFGGLQAIVVAIVAHAAFTFGRAWLKDWRGIIIALIGATMFGFGTNPILVILAAATFGLVLYAKMNNAAAQAVAEERPYALQSFLFILLLAVVAFVLLFAFSKPLFDLAFLMSRIDLFAFGGGFSSLPIMFNAVVNQRAWMDSHTFMNGIVLGQVTPGPIVITATFIGYFLYGPLGAVIATIFIFLPSFMLLVGIEPYFSRLRRSLYFNRAVQGVLCSFVGLLISVAIQFSMKISWDMPRILLACGAVGALSLDVDIAWIVLAGGIISAIIL